MTTTIRYRVVNAPSIDRLADSWTYAFRGKIPVEFTLERDHTQPGNERPVRIKIEDGQVLGLKYLEVWPLTVELELFVPTKATGGTIQPNATAVIHYPRRKGTLEFRA